MHKKDILKEFISLYFELLEYIKSYLNNNNDFNAFYKKNIILKKTNIKLFIKKWHEYISIKYYDKIINEDINFFMNPNKYFFQEPELNEMILKYIKIIKDKYDEIDKNIIKIIMNKIKKLTQISILYFNKD